MTRTLNSLALWEREYRNLQSIPSSSRALPSKALLLLEPLIGPKRDFLVLDAGCGNGRNAVHLATRGCRIVASDFSPAALSATAQSAALSGMRDKIEIMRVDLSESFPFVDDSFDFCVDSYVSCHFSDAVFVPYWSELTRVTRKGGFVFTSMFSLDDEYYQAIARSAPTQLPYVTDPVNGLTKRLHTEESFKALFRAPLAALYFAKFQFVDRVLGSDYRRSLLISLLQKS